MQFIGSDFQTQPVNNNMQDSKMLDLPNLADASANSIRQSIGEVQRLNSAASNADAEAAGRKVVVQQKEGGGVIGAVADLAKFGVDYFSKQEEARLKAEAAAAEKEFILEANKLAANAPDLIEKTNEGGIGYQSKVEALAAKYGGRVDAATLNTQLLRMYTPVQNYQEKSVESLRKEGEKIRETNVSTFVTQQVMSLDTTLADLELESDATKRQIRVDNAFKLMTDSLVNSTLRKEDRLYAQNAILNVIGKSSAAGSRIGAEVMGGMRTINDLNEFVERIKDLPEEEQAGLLTAKYATIRDPRIREAFKDRFDPTAKRRAYIESFKEQQVFDEAVKRGEIDANKAFQIKSGAATELTAYYLSATGVERAQLRKQFEGIPSLESVTIAADNYLKDQTKKEDLAKESLQLAGVVAGLGKSDAKERLGWVQQAFQMPNLSLNIGVVQELQEAVKAYTKALNTGTPAEVQKAQQDVERYNKVVLDAANARVRQVDQLMKDTSAPWGQLETLLRDPKKRPVLEQSYSETLRNLQQQREQRRQDTLRGTNPNFNMPQLATVQVGDVRLPLPFKAGTQVSFSGNYKEVTELRGNREHAGIDIAVAENTPLIAPISGVIASARVDGGYGNFIDLRTPDGKIIRYAHLNKMNVKEGQQVIAGQVIGASGNTGTSTGAHLHFEVRNDLYGGVEKTEDPIAWSVKNINNSNRGTRSRFGANTPANMPRDAVPLSGAYLKDGQIVRADGTSGTPSYTNRNPIRNMPLPMDKSQYQSSEDKNYGYQELARNAPFRKELHRVAKSLGTPAQWFADAMAFETGGTFAASIDNGLGYTGLIQFGDEAAQDVGTTRAALAQMSNTQQLKYVEKFLKMRSDAYGLKYDKPEAIIVGIWGRVQDIKNYIKDPQLIKNVEDVNITFSEYVKRLGEHAGRRYQTSYDSKVAPIHTSYRASCAMCQTLQRAGMGFLPHEAP